LELCEKYEAGFLIRCDSTWVLLNKHQTYNWIDTKVIIEELEGLKTREEQIRLLKELAKLAELPDFDDGPLSLKSEYRKFYPKLEEVA